MRRQTLAVQTIRLLGAVAARQAQRIRKWEFHPEQGGDKIFNNFIDGLMQAL
jgi:hypothetical protein